ncbi:M28 family peptidase [Pedobacter insulae]|uniref:PA domain-containing protein n=1 Tax=Pedobacter insulae TaxID=414048 RepID=A0A1I2WHX8_9SPHI|nr:M28 family peptidase [Pedobacter insulae]SFH00953.1 PA domain-containing protein [Pedobacter insulae]
MKTKILTLVCFLSIINNVYSQERINADVTTAMQHASADIMKADITYLADDKLLGRQPGKPGYQMAVDYVVSELQKNGVKPAGEKGTWVQTILMRKATVIPGFSASLNAEGIETLLVGGKDIALTPNPIAAQSSVDAGLVFVGYGITAPGLNYDDYKDLNVKGKVVLVIRGTPETFPSSDAAHHQNLVTIQSNALAHGAVGVILCTATSNSRGFMNPRPSTSMLDSKGKLVSSSSYPFPKIKIVGMLSNPICQTIFSKAGKQLAETVTLLKSGKPQSFVTDFKLKASYQSTYTDFNTFNVAGKIAGTDPKLKKEFVVHSAHLDHVGVGAVVAGDSIYNGAHDNASGVASLLQITKIYQNLKVKPKRSVLILMVTGEEMGLLGSSYFATKPTVPVKNIVANVNTDMPAIIAPLLSVAPLGAEHSTLINPVSEAASHLGLTVEADPEPKENRFVRSDQYSFIKQGIPALHIKYGNKTADGKNDLNLFVEKWRAKYYHKPQDDINGIFDFEAGRKYAQLNFLIGYLVANDEQRPSWNPGDIFEKK